MNAPTGRRPRPCGPVGTEPAATPTQRATRPNAGWRRVMADGTDRKRLGCVCVVFVSEEGGTHRGSYARCLDHKRLMRDNRVED